jgi:hypothetical protein
VLQAAWRHLFPHLPAPAALHRRTHWWWGALAGLRQPWCRALPAMARDGRAVDTSPLQGTHRRRGHGPEQWDGPQHRRAACGDGAASDAWC